MKKIISILLLVFAMVTVQAYTITSYSPSAIYTGLSDAQVSALNTAVGISTWSVETFEGPSMIPGMTVLGTVGYVNTNTKGLWDGSRFLYTSGSATFNFATGVAGFAVGMGDIESDLRMYINGIDHGLVRSFAGYQRTVDDGREIFIKVALGVSDALITQIRFETPNTGDWIYFDHLAVVPEPATFSMIALFVFALFFRRMKK